MRPNSRCAIYTRKSSEEGLEQSFNSLDAQREACEAYVVSQRHEGWRAVPTFYDDGGYSGGDMGRPALKQLLEDVKANKVDTIVVYKLDRLPVRRWFVFSGSPLSDSAKSDLPRGGHSSKAVLSRRTESHCSD